MSSWPTSIPDYKWPKELLSIRRAPRRWMAASIFHVSYAAGRCVSLLRPNRPGVLVIRTDGIGDAVLAEPMLRSLSQQFASQELHLWAPEATCQLFRAAPYIRHRLATPRGFKEGNLAVFSDTSWRARLGYRLGRWNFSVAVYPARSPEPLGNWLFSFARAGERWYSPGNTENQFATQQVATSGRATKLLGPSVGATSSGHELERNARLALHWQSETQQFSPTIHLDDAALAESTEQQRTWRQIAGWLGATAVVGLMPAASAAVKKYPARQWAAAVRQLWLRHRIVCALLGGPGDSGDVEELAGELDHFPRLKMSHPLDVAAMAGLIGALDGILSVDTGLAHIALAQGVPTVIVTGGSHPGRFFPWPRAKRAETLNYAMPCEGCLGRCHLSEPHCVTRIDPEEIVLAMAKLLGRQASVPLRVAV